MTKTYKDWEKIIEDEMTHVILPGTAEYLAKRMEEEIQHESNAWKYIAEWNGRLLTEAYREIHRLKTCIVTEGQSYD